MTNPIWHRGPPPSIGWWPASYNKTRGVYRWWDGYNWSSPCTDDCTPDQAGYGAKMTCELRSPIDIYWHARPRNWPKRSKT
jgi:hypothetical protein